MRAVKSIAELFPLRRERPTLANLLTESKASGIEDVDSAVMDEVRLRFPVAIDSERKQQAWIPPNGRDNQVSVYVCPDRPELPEDAFFPKWAAQEAFLRSRADIVVFGGSAGGGKSAAILMEPLRHIDNPDFSAIIFRRTYGQITQLGGLWDQATKFYPALGGVARRGEMMWVFPSGARIKFAHLQHEDTVHTYMGSALCLIAIDEGTHLTPYQFWYLLSRNRSTCGVRPYVRLSCNPDADSWLAEFLKWWIDEDSGLPLPERAGVLRWFVRVNEALVWADTPEELVEAHPGLVPKSATFVPSRVTDNVVLMQKDPGYLANLMALPPIERGRLLDGNWRVRAEAGKVLNRAWFGIADAVPAGGTECRFWDFAATVQEVAGDDPDYSASVKMRCVNGTFYITDVTMMRATPGVVTTTLENMARQDNEAAKLTGTRYHVAWEEEPGSASRYQTRTMARQLAGIQCAYARPQGDKVTRAYPLSAQAQPGVENVKLVPSMFADKKMVEEFLRNAHGFPDLPHDDLVDACTGAFSELTKRRSANVY